MKFIDKQNDVVIETTNEFLIEQYKKHSEKYEVLVEEKKETKKKITNEEE